MQYHSAGGIVVSPDSQCGWLYLVILQRRNTGEVQWVAPKGQVELSETPEETAKREVVEETGLVVSETLGPLGSQTYGFELLDGSQHEKVVDWFLFRVGNPKAPTLNEEEGFLEHKWLPFDQARTLFSHVAFLPFLEKCRLILEKTPQSS